MLDNLTDGTILPFVEVDCGRIGAFLGPGLFALSSRAREKVFLRAIARVAAHELYHVFTQKARTLHRKGTQAWLELSLRSQ